MTTTTFLTTVKLLLLLPLVVIVLFVAQVSAPLVQERPLQVQTNDEKIANFREEVENINKKAVTCIERVDGHDEVVQKYEHYTKRILAVVARVYLNRKYGLMCKYIVNPLDALLKEMRIPSESKVIEISEAIRQFNRLFEESKLIPPLQDFDSSLNDIVKMSDEVLYGSKTVLRSYYERKRNEKTIWAIVTFFDDQKKDNLEERKNELANFIVPFVTDIFRDYDGAIDYITRLYKEHCRDPESVVQQFASYYIKVWWSSVTRVTNSKFDPTDWALWNEFMATACPFPQYSPFDPNTLKPASTKKIQQFPIEGATPLDLVDFEQEIKVPEQVENLRSHLTMIKGSFKNCDLVGQLVASFSEYKVLSEDDRKAHDENLWIGYQKKLIVVGTIVWVVVEESEKAKNYLKGPKEDFIKWHSHWSTVDGPIPNVIVRLVNRALHRSKYFNNQDDALASQKLVILTSVLKFLFGKTVRFEPPKESENLTDSENIEDVKIQEEIKMFYTSSSSPNQMIKYSEVMDKVVAHFSRMSLLGNEKLDRGFNVEAWALLVLTIVPDLEKMPKESILLIPDVNVTTKKPTFYGRTLNWVSENKCLTGVIVAFIIGIPLIISLMGSESSTTSIEGTLANTTWSAESTDDTGAWIVWLIVGAMIIGAILLVGVVLYLICRTKRKRNHGGRNSTSNAKTKKANETASTVSTQCSSNASSSKRPSTSLFSSGGASNGQSRSPVKTPARDLIIKAKQRKAAVRKVCRKVTQTSPVNSSSIVVPIASSLKPSPVSPGGSSISVLYASRNKSSKVESKVAPENSTLFTSAVVPSSTCPVSPPKKVKGSPTRTPKSPSGKAQSPTRKDAQKKKNPNNKK